MLRVTVTGPSATRERWVLDQLRHPRRILPVTVPLLALVLVGVVVHTGGRHIDLEVYRFGVQAWLHGGDMYGTLPETSDHITLPFIYPPFAALVMVPLAVVPWVVSWTVQSGELVISVEDPSHDLPVRRNPAPDAPSGRGLAIVESLSSDWGVEHTDRGKRVWAKLPVA